MSPAYLTPQEILEEIKRVRALTPDYLSLWAGRGVTRSRAMPANELVAALVRERTAVR